MEVEGRQIQVEVEGGSNDVLSEDEGGKRGKSGKSWHTKFEAGVFTCPWIGSRLRIVSAACNLPIAGRDRCCNRLEFEFEPESVPKDESMRGCKDIAGFRGDGNDGDKWWWMAAFYTLGTCSRSSNLMPSFRHRFPYHSLRLCV